MTPSVHILSNMD